ncbi:MAG: DNA recombination protein RmuC [Flavobacteriales bacterium]|nr:DNA recombination protein RmuC [Flavobacteriales bacterium]
MEIALILIGILVGFALGYLFFKVRSGGRAASSDMAEWQQIQAENSNLKIERGRLEERILMLENELRNAQAKMETERNQILRLTNELATSQNANENLLQRLHEQKQEVEQLQEKFKTEFKNIANELLEDKSKRFTEQNQEKLGEILKPLNERIKSFEERVENSHKESLERNAGLIQQILSLRDLNKQMSEEARNLTKALKGDNKAQGNWGEVILERVLEKSGLMRDREYVVQESVTTEDGRRLQPDVVIKLPENKNIVIDSKVSLLDYERFTSAETQEEQDAHMKNHIRSLRAHVKGLSEKNYHQLYGSGSPDFVLLFVPIEPAFTLAVQHEAELFNEAFEKNIVIVSTSTLLATLRTISSIWRQENQTRNAVEIARQAGDMYDKFEGFVQDLIKVGKQLDAAKDGYGEAMKKLYEGRGNLVNRAEKLKELGAKASKSLPSQLVERSAED